MLRRIPTKLRVAWLLLVVGIILLAIGLIRHALAYDLAGAACVIMGMGISVIDMFVGRKTRGSGFHGGIFLSALISAIVVGWIVLPLAVIVWGIMSLIHGFEWGPTFGVIRFIGIIFLYLTVAGIPRMANNIVDPVLPQART
ncbi:hypothetical protein Hhel01_03606 [Haloferula helveola]